MKASFVELCRAIASCEPTDEKPAERLDVLVLDEAGREEALEALIGAGELDLHLSSFGDIWLRDTAPIFLKDEKGRLFATAFRFNGWGGKYLLPGDETVAAEVAAIAGVYLNPADIVLEGGAVEVDGEGTCITTRQCVLNENRNPGMNESDAERILGPALGVSKFIWLDEGLANDHTDGHVDNIVRFVGPGRVACMSPEASDPNRRVLQDVRARLRGARDAAGRRLEIIDVPSCGAILSGDGALMPASYMNFFISNHAVIVPVYGSRSDHLAVDLIGGCFPDRRVVGIDARTLLEGGGAFHCITQQQPSIVGKEGFNGEQ